MEQGWKRMRRSCPKGKERLNKNRPYHPIRKRVDKQSCPKRIITLFGSVGDRAQLRREELGTTSGRLADFTVVTEDDPGFEDPKKIADEIASYVEKAGGAGKYVVIPDREEAVAYAVAMLEPGDFLLCCGKGHERFMKVRGKKEPFNEEQCIEEALKKRGIEL